MIDTLNKVVSKVIVPQYSWIRDFVWKTNNYGGSRYYSLELVMDKDFYLTSPYSHETYDKLFNDTKMLFRMVGPEENEFFDDVTVTVEGLDD